MKASLISSVPKELLLQPGHLRTEAGFYYSLWSQHLVGVGEAQNK